jgi:predicted nucleotidyltransferase
MRLSVAQRHALKDIVHGIARDASVYLFGSRAHDDRRGGDIDMLVIAERPLSLRERIRIQTAFQMKFGPQKLDVVSFARDAHSPFKQLALHDAVLL